MSAQGDERERAAFTNEAVSADSLPAHADLELEKVSPRFSVYAASASALTWGAGAALLWALPIPAGVAVVGAPWAPWALLLIGALSSALAWIDGRRRAFAMREHDLVYERGLVVRKTVIVPVPRIQHIETTSGPLERRFGLERLTCFTAGGVSADLVIRGLEAARAKQVRDYVLRRIEARGVADRNDQAETETDVLSAADSDADEGPRGG